MAGRAGFESVEHTADLAIRAWAEEMSGLIEQSARGMLDLMLSQPPDAADSVQILGTGDDREELVIDCLRQILLLIDTEGLVPVSARVLRADETQVRCEVGVVAIEDGREALAEDIKAVTYHALEVRSRDGMLEVEIVFDV